MSNSKILEAALDERYEYLESLKESQEYIKKVIEQTENDIDELLLKIFQIDPPQKSI